MHEWRTSQLIEMLLFTILTSSWAIALSVASQVTPFFRPLGKNDLDNDPLQGRSLLKQVNHREKQNAI